MDSSRSKLPRLSILSKFTLICVILIVNLLFPVRCKSQNFTSEDIVISLLTCSSGSELYSAYGHSAIRLKDPNLGLDVVFNYGTFDFDTPFFYLKFLNGTLDYMLSTVGYSRFIRSYAREGRGVEESELILSTSQKAEIERLLFENAQPQNRFYRYDFFSDNCATRIRDVVFKVADVDVGKLKSNVENVTYRDCLHEKVGPNEWSGFGIDIILGVRADKRVSAYEKALLPDYLRQLFNDVSLTTSGRHILTKREKDAQPAVITPTLCISLFLVVVVALSLIEALSRKWFRWFDVLLAVVCSLLAVLLWYLWVVSEIRITDCNMNVLWASALYAPLLFAIAKRKTKMLKVLSSINLLLIAIFFVAALFGVQYASAPIVLIALALAVRNMTYLRRI